MSELDAYAELEAEGLIGVPENGRLENLSASDIRAALAKVSGTDDEAETPAVAAPHWATTDAAQTAWSELSERLPDLNDRQGDIAALITARPDLYKPTSVDDFAVKTEAAYQAASSMSTASELADTEKDHAIERAGWNYSAAETDEEVVAVLEDLAVEIGWNDPRFAEWVRGLEDTDKHLVAEWVDGVKADVATAQQSSALLDRMRESEAAERERQEFSAEMDRASVAAREKHSDFEKLLPVAAELLRDMPVKSAADFEPALEMAIRGAREHDRVTRVDTAKADIVRAALRLPGRDDPNYSVDDDRERLPQLDSTAPDIDRVVMPELTKTEKHATFLGAFAQHRGAGDAFKAASDRQAVAAEDAARIREEQDGPQRNPRRARHGR